MKESNKRATGTVKWFNKSRGYGFVTPDNGSEDLFLHQSVLGENVQFPLSEGDRVAFAVESHEKGPAAIEVARLDAASSPAPSANGHAFAALGLHETLLRAVRDAGYRQPTPIQTQAIPHVLAGRDLLGCAQTGTGKTAAFALPILQRLSGGAPLRRGTTRPVRALVVAPTRELALQIGESFTTYGSGSNLRNVMIFGGVGQGPQVAALRRGVDVVVATPGRLLDLLGQGLIQLDQVEILVLDEADRMLDMGFLPDVRRIVRALPQQRQTLLFSATMPQPIISLAHKIMHRPIQISVTPRQPTVEAIEQAIFFVSGKKKQALLEHVLNDSDVTRALVFTRTKHSANRVVKKLQRSGISAEPIHGNKSQNARQRSLKNFRSGKTRVLVATDVVARGIDVDEVSHVIQYDLPNEPETYVHRIGRTGRAGSSGVALAFCAGEERAQLKQIEKLLGERVPVVAQHPHND